MKNSVTLIVATDNDAAFDFILGYVTQLGGTVKEFVEASDDPKALVQVTDNLGFRHYP